MFVRASQILVTTLIACVWTNQAFACPRCAAGIAARREVVEQGFVNNLLIALLPFAVVVLISIWAERIGKVSTREKVG
jgi:hypothetical protein